MSTWKPESDLMRLNAAPVGEWVSLPTELVTVLAFSLGLAAESNGVFDIAIGDSIAAWGFGASQGKLDLALIRRAAKPPMKAMKSLELDAPGGRARKLAAMNLDLSGVAKGFGVDELARVCATHGLSNWLVGIDGEMRSFGRKPDDACWAIALEKPLRGKREPMGVLELDGMATATSGDYRHYVEIGDLRLSHTIDPRNGRPIANRLASVTVIAGTCMAADAWATALMVLGEEEGPAFARATKLEAIFLVRTNEGLKTIVSGDAASSSAV